MLKQQKEPQIFNGNERVLRLSPTKEYLNISNLIFFYKYVLNDISKVIGTNHKDNTVRITILVNEYNYTKQLIYCYEFSPYIVDQKDIFDETQINAVKKWINFKSTVTLWSWIKKEFYYWTDKI